jgi:hypothetical protein
MSKRVLLFLAGMLAGALLAQTPAVEAQAARLMFGSFSNSAKAIQVDTNGYVKVQVN